MEYYQEMGFLSRELSEFPYIINLNVYRGHCPCRCVHCPVGQVSLENRGKRFAEGEIDLALFKRVVDEIAEGFYESTLRIHSVGEPLLWKNLGAAVKYAHEKGIKTWIFTSGVTDNRQLLETLCKNIDIIEISINSCDKNDYKKTKGVDCFEKVSANIHYMVQYIKQQMLSTHLICSRVQTENQDADEAFVKYWKQYEGISDVFVRSYHTYNGLLEDASIRPVQGQQACLVFLTS